MATERKHYPEIGLRLRKIREGFSEMNQTEWAEAHGFNKTQYHQWEKGVRRIPLEAAEKICARYGMTLDGIYLGRLDGLSSNARKVF